MSPPVVFGGTVCVENMGPVVALTLNVQPKVLRQLSDHGV